MKSRLFLVGIVVCCFGLFTKSMAQCTVNMLTNPSFELPLQSSTGDNITGSSVFNGWTIPGSDQFNIVRVNGTVYGQGPDTAQDGNQYADIVKQDGVIQQSFVLSCPSNIDFSGYFSRREAGGNNFTSYIEILDASGTVVSTSSVVTFTINESQEVWKQVTGSAFLPAGNYTFSFSVDNFANVDNGFLCITPLCVLPVKLSLFEGSSNNCSNILSWHTESEENVKQYDIEYSENGINFIKAGEVAALNNYQGSSYHFIHATAFKEKAYYRIKLVNKNGSHTQSQQLVIKNDCIPSAYIKLLSENPVKNVLRLAVGGLPANTPLIIYNAYGNKITCIKINNGNSSFDMSTYTSGTYFFKTTVPSGDVILRVNKL
jgi:hypothetical protein